jgi:hypothetical protein
MSEERINRKRRIEDICNIEQEAIDPCLPIKPVNLNKRKADACDPDSPEDGIEKPESCNFDNLVVPTPAPIEPAPTRQNTLYRNKEISISCNQLFQGLPAVDGDTVQLVIEAGEFTSNRSQEDADAIAEAVVLSRIQCFWGNILTEVQCEDSDNVANDEGTYVIPDDGIQVKFNANDYQNLRFDERGNNEYQQATEDLKAQANTDAANLALGAVQCVWTNDLLNVTCDQVISDVTPYVVPNIDDDGNIISGTRTIYVTDDTSEKISDETVVVDAGVTSVVAQTADKGTVDFADNLTVKRYTVNYTSDYKAQANADGFAVGEGEIVCLFENLKLTVSCCETFNPLDTGLDKVSDPDHLQFYYDTHYTSGNPPLGRDDPNAGFPSKSPNPQVFPSPTLAPGVTSGDLIVADPYITASFTSRQIVDAGGDPLPVTEQNELLSENCNLGSGVEIPLESGLSIVETPVDVWRTIDGLTNRCNNRFIDGDYIDNNDVITIKEATFVESERGSAYLNSVNLALLKLQCVWGNDPQTGTLCPLDASGNEVDPRSLGSKENPAGGVGANVTQSDISKADANDQAEITAIGELNCFWSNDAVDARCPTCVDPGTLPTMPEPVYYRRTNEYLTIFDHCGNFLHNNMVDYYNLYEAIHQDRVLNSPDPAKEGDIDDFIRNDMNVGDYVLNPVTGIEYYKTPDMTTISPTPSGDPNDYYYNNTAGFSPCSVVVEQSLVESGEFKSIVGKNEAQVLAQSEADSGLDCTFVPPGPGGSGSGGSGSGGSGSGSVGSGSGT